MSDKSPTLDPNDPLEMTWTNTTFRPIPATKDDGSRNKLINVATVILFANGMVMAFDDDGDQLPELQGTEQEFFDKVFRLSDRYNFAETKYESRMKLGPAEQA